MSSMSKNQISIGELIKQEMIRQGLTQDQLANRINRCRSRVYDIFNATSLNTDLLKDISQALNHDFFKELSSSLQDEGGDGEPSEQLTGVSNSGIYSSLGPAGIEERLGRSLRATMLEREQLKATLDEFMLTAGDRPLLILEQGYTFGAHEVVEQVACRNFGSWCFTTYPTPFSVTAVKTSPYKVLLKYLDGNTMSEKAIYEWFEDISTTQKDTKRKAICVVHASDSQRVNDFFKQGKNDFFCVEYIWNRQSLLSWARDHGLHVDIISFIERHQAEPHLLLRNGMPPSFPTAMKCSASQWLAASDYLGFKTDSKDAPSAPLPKELINEIKAFRSPLVANRNDILDLPWTIKATLQINGYWCDVDVPLRLSGYDAGALLYLTQYAHQTMFKDVDEDERPRLFDAWLRENHPALREKALKAMNESIPEILYDWEFDDLPLEDNPFNLDNLSHDYFWGWEWDEPEVYFDDFLCE